MLQEQTAALRLPKAVQESIDDLVRALAAATTREDLERERAMQLGFILGLETAKRLRPADIETLYMIFDDALQERLCEIAGQS